MRESVTLRHNK